MKDIVDKISSYNLFNYLFPGVIFAYLVSNLTKYNLIQEDFLVGAFLYYFVGLVISRFGSLVIEPTFRETGILKFADYRDYISASKKDQDIVLLSEVNNMYRTITSMLFLALLVKGYEWLSIKLCWTLNTDLIILTILLVITFIFSYQKQTGFITKRVNFYKEKGND